MTPQQEQKLNEVYEWVQQRKRQQIVLPLDDPSRTIIGGFQDEGAGSTSLTQQYTDSRGDTHTGPKAYAGTRLWLADGTRYEVPYLSTS